MNKNEENNTLKRGEIMETLRKSQALRKFNLTTSFVEDYVKWVGDLGIFVRRLTNQNEIDKVEEVIALFLTHVEIKAKEAKDYRK